MQYDGRTLNVEGQATALKKMVSDVKQYQANRKEVGTRRRTCLHPMPSY